MRGTGGAFRSYGAQMRGLWHMFIMLACFELLTQPDGSHRRRCCVRRIIWTRTLAFMAWNGCRPLQGCCGSNVRRFHRPDRRKSTLECRRGEKAFFRRPAKNEREVEIGLVFIFALFLKGWIYFQVYMPQTGKFGLLFPKKSAQTQKGSEFIL
jgi:hypothetical protein